MIEKLDGILVEFENSLSALEKEADVLNLKSQFLGKKGALTEILKGLRDCTPEERKQVGPKANAIKEKIQLLSAKKLEELELSAINEKLEKNKIDISVLDRHCEDRLRSGSYHPRSIVQKELEDIFLSMGFEVLDGPHIENEYFNFEALNIPGDHPARDMQDTFWFDDPDSEVGRKHLLRTHTSPIQVRGMKTRKPPFRFIAPGTVFRCERTDASHEMIFLQMEGMMIDKDLSVGNLIYFMKSLLSEIFQKEVEVRLRPGYFPFVEPGFELDIKCLICGGKGCSVCKHSGWVELLPCGMVHPHVLEHGGIDSKEYNGWAFGLGLDRLVMMRHGIDDIRHLGGGDLRFHSQFTQF